MTNILELIERATQVASYPVKWNINDASVYSQIDTLETRATGDLRAFECVDRVENSAQKTYLQSISVEVPIEITFVANSAWKICGGREDPRRARLIIAAARAEFTRSELAQMLWLVMDYSAEEVQANKYLAEQLEAVTHRDWFDADATARHPIVAALRSSACSRFTEWLDLYVVEKSTIIFESGAPETKVMRGVTWAEMLNAIMLTWIDEAAFRPAQSLALMAQAAEASYGSGFQAGLIGGEAYIKERAARAGRRGGAERHKRTAELKAWATQQAATMRGAEMDIARELERQIPSHLENVSSDPRRLIYDTLRDVRKDQSSKPLG